MDDGRRVSPCLAIVTRVESLSRLPSHRPFTTADAVACGVSPRNLTRLVDEGLLRRIFKGLYVVYDVKLTLDLRAAALARMMPRNAVAVDETAGWLHGVDLNRGLDDDELPRLSFFQLGPHERLRNAAVQSGSRQLAPTDIMQIGDVLVATPLRTAVDLARLRWPKPALAALDGLLRLGAFTKADLILELERFKGYRGIVQARALAPLADARSESPAESWLRLEWLSASDLPRPTPQLPVWGPFSTYPWFLDLAVEDLKYAAEYDGQRFHSSDEQRERDAKKRNWLAEEGWIIDVFERDDVYPRTASPAMVIRAGIREARRRAGRPASEWRWPRGPAGSRDRG